MGLGPPRDEAGDLAAKDLCLAESALFIANSGRYGPRGRSYFREETQILRDWDHLLRERCQILREGSQFDREEIQILRERSHFLRYWPGVFAKKTKFFAKDLNSFAKKVRSFAMGTNIFAKKISQNDTRTLIKVTVRSFYRKDLMSRP